MKLALIERHLQTLLLPQWVRRFLVHRVRMRAAADADATHHGSVRRLYLDLSTIARHDAGTGIQRLVRSVATTVANESPLEWQVLPCAATNKKRYRQITWPEKTTEERDLDWRAGDVFLGLDFALDTIPRYRRDLWQMKQQGVRLWFVMYDMLPDQRPDWFSDKLVVRYRRWLQTICEIADGFYCISPAVTEELRQYLERNLGLPKHLMPALITLPMGWEISYAPHSHGVGLQVDALLKSMQQRDVPTALMVGTLEPRKGHADVLAAFEQLWQQRQRCRLVIAGRPGWKTGPLQQTIRKYIALGMQVHWLDNATDEEIQQLYAECTGVIVASYGEGFGLPLLEALGHGKPVLARDIPVFHTVKAATISYFPAEIDAPRLAEQIESWLSIAKTVEVSENSMSLSSWKDTVSAIISGLQDDAQFQLQVGS